MPDAQWNDWRWQLSHRLNTLDELSSIINLTPEESEGIRSHHFRVDITPYFASLIDPDDPNCPIRRQVVPTGQELVAFDGMVVDSLDEDGHSPVPGLVHRYPDRVLMLVTTQCASYCRYCTRSRMVGDAGAQFSRGDYDRQIAYIAATPASARRAAQRRRPADAAAEVLEDILRRLRAIPHVEIIRIGSRVPVFLPQRITPELVEMLRHPSAVDEHPLQPSGGVTPEVARPWRGWPTPASRWAARPCCWPASTTGRDDEGTGAQAGGNRVRPYYLYQCDLVEGAGHFRTPVSKGIEIIEALRGHTTGFAVPTYVIDAPGGGGKIPVMPQYLISQSPGKVVVRNFEGFITTYDEPNDYTGHTVARPEQQHRQPKPGRGRPCPALR